MHTEQAFVIRPARLSDLDWFHAITNNTGAGFTSLQHDKDYLHKRLIIVEQSFKQQIPIEERIYLFVRENLPEGDLVGTSGIDVSVGYKESFYNYQLSTVAQSCTSLDIYVQHTMLNIVNNFQNASELISFWLHPNMRGKSAGKSMSLCRFLFIASFAEWFGDEIIAELIGVVDENSTSPFWEAVGRKFFAMDFKQADALTLTKGKQFIADLISREPIYLDLLPQAAQDVVGKTHKNTQAALHILQEQGFKYHNHIDIFDAGPLITCERDNIHCVKNSKVATVGQIKSALPNSVKALLFNNKVEARFTEASIDVTNPAQVSLTVETAKILELDLGNTLRYILID